MSETPWRLTVTKPPPAERQTWWKKLPTAQMTRSGMSDPEAYVPDEALIDAFNTALLLGQPLLLTGEPGCGKTEAANYLAWRLGLSRKMSKDRFEHALRFDTKSTTLARDLFYDFDVVSRFHDSQLGKDIDPPHQYVTLNAVGRAIVDASRSDEAVALRTRRYGIDPGLRRSVVLIDEIDKAPRETPNDLLVEFEKLQFYLRELGTTFEPEPGLQPILVLTSNRERGLPDAFLRRCAFHALSFPEPSQLRDIVALRIPEYPSDEVSLAPVLEVFEALRAPRTNLRRSPGTAELLGFVSCLADLEIAGRKAIKASRAWQGPARATLIKHADDYDRIDEAFLSGLVAG